MNTTITADALHTPDVVYRPGWLTVSDERVAAIGAGTGFDRHGDIMRLPAGCTIVPGLVDMHTHGAGGGNMTAPNAEDLLRARQAMLRHGITATVASLVTAPVDELTTSLALIAEQTRHGSETTDPAARLLGAHLEGPFLSYEHRGSHWAPSLALPDVPMLRSLLEAGEGAIRMMTVAPELPGALEIVRRLADVGVVCAIGHTGAGVAEVDAAVSGGSQVATHLFNGMQTPHHRTPGPAMALLADDRVVVELINDGVHVHQTVARVAVRAAGYGRLALVSDGVAATGAPDGDYMLGRTAIRQRDGRVETADGSSLGGGVMTLDGCLRRAVTHLGMSLADAVMASTATPARALNVAEQVGHLGPGRRADLCVLGPDLTVWGVMLGGRWIEPPSEHQRDDVHGSIDDDEESTG